MRWIFLALLLVNLLCLAYGQWWSPAGQSLADTSPSKTEFQHQGEDLTLVREAPENQLRQRLEDQGAGSGQARLCLSAGPFVTEEQAKNLVARLQAIEIKAKFSQLSVAAGEGYWVYLPAPGSRDEARRKLSELQALGVDSYIIPKGELANGISLGVFSREELAQKKLAALKKQGLKPLLHKIERSKSELWVFLDYKEEQKLDRNWWLESLKQEFQAEERQNFCLDVASRENIH